MAPRTGLSERAEQAAIDADSTLQERGPLDAGMPTVAPGFIHATSPDGAPVVFTPGEMLPGWAADLLPTAKWSTAAGVFVLGGA